MAFLRSNDDADPVARPHGPHRVERRTAYSTRLATGTLACPVCDAPVALLDGPVTPGQALACPYCEHLGAVRDFLSLKPPARPTRVTVRVVSRGVRARSARRASPAPAPPSR